MKLKKILNGEQLENWAISILSTIDEEEAFDSFAEIYDEYEGGFISYELPDFSDNVLLIDAMIEVLGDIEVTK